MSQIYNDYKSWQSITKQSCIGDWYINTQLCVGEVNENRMCQTVCAVTNEIWWQTRRITNMNREFDQYRKLNQTLTVGENKWIADRKNLLKQEIKT